MPTDTAPALHPVRQQAGHQAAIVFVHGFGGSITETWQQFPAFLQADPALAGWDIWLLGYASHLSIDVLGLWAADPDIAKLGERVATDVLQGTLAGYQSVAFVAHSMGGLVVQRALLDSAALARRTSHLLLYGTPSAGLKKATMAWLLKPQLRNMAAGGAFITGLRSQWQAQFGAPGAMPFRLMAAAGERDEFVPAESALGPFRKPPFDDCTAVVPGNHTSMVKPDTAQAPGVRLAVQTLTDSRGRASASDAANLAVELSQFQEAIARWLPQADQLDRQACVQLAIALDHVGRRDDAVALLRRHAGAGSHTDAIGTLAGRLKRRWLANRLDADGREALALYQQALALARTAQDLAQATYHGINVAFLQFALDERLPLARETAAQVLRDCAAAAAAGAESADATLWRRATEAEAQLLLGDHAQAERLYRAVLSDCRPAPWQRDSMHLQALHLGHLLGGAALQQEVGAWFRPGAGDADGRATGAAARPGA